MRAHHRRLCRRRERLARRRRPAVRPRTHAHQAAVRRPLPARAVAAGQFAGVGQADGARARRQLARRAAAAPAGAQDRRGRREVPDRAAGRQPRRDPVAGQRGDERAPTSTGSITPPTTSPRASARRPTNGWCRARMRSRASRCSPTTRTWRSAFPASGISPAWSGRASTSAAPPRPARPPSCSATTARSAGASPPPTSTARTCSSSGSIRPIPTATSRPTARGRSACATRRSTSRGAIR